MSKKAVERLVRTSISLGEVSYMRNHARSELEGQRTYVNYLKRWSGKRYAESLDEEGRKLMKRQERDAQKRVEELANYYEKLARQVWRLQTSIQKTRQQLTG